MGSEEEGDVHVWWMLDEILRLTNPTQNTPTCIPVLLGIITALAQNIPDMKTAKKIRGEMNDMVFGAQLMWPMLNSDNVDTVQ
jgi:hypothetical protein